MRGCKIWPWRLREEVWPWREPIKEYYIKPDLTPLVSYIRLYELPQEGLLGVIRAGGVAGGGADTFVLFVDEGVAVELLVLGVAPELFAHALVQAFGEGFGEAVGEGFEK